MKKFTLYIILPIVFIFCFLSVKTYYDIQSTDISVLKKCHKTKMYDVFLCPGGKNYTRIDQISKHFLNLIVIAEDASFYSHNGFDWHEIRQSFEANLRALSYLRGGSTITQQLVKNVFLSPEKSIQRKFIEAMLAAKIEKKYSKKVILERYVNVIEFGKNIYGIKKAARHYFNKSPSELNVLESAFLVYLVPSPKKYSGVFYKKQLTNYSRKRIKTLIRKLKLYKKIPEQEYDVAVSKIDEFPWANTNLFYQLNDNPDTLLNESEQVLPDAVEEQLQKDISDEIQSELEAEDDILDREEPDEEYPDEGELSTDEEN